MNIKPVILICCLATAIFVGGCGKKPTETPDGTSDNPSATLGQESDVDWRELKYSFTREQYVHPLIIQELLGWLSDSGGTTVEIDLTMGNNSNRFNGNVEIKKTKDGAWVHASKYGGYVAYRLLGVSPSGVHMLHCRQSGGGSGIFNSVLLVKFKKDQPLISTNSSPLASERILLRSVGQISLGDRYQGDITYKDGVLRIGPDLNPQKQGFREKEKIVRIE